MSDVKAKYAFERVLFINRDPYSVQSYAITVYVLLH